MKRGRLGVLWGGLLLGLGLMGSSWASSLEAREGKFYTAEGRLFFPTWAFGVESVEDLPLYRQVGFNVLWWPVRWRDVLSEEAAAEALEAARREGLEVILCLQVGEPLRRPLRPVQYEARTRDWFRMMVERFGSAPNLLGWALEEEPEACVQFSDEAFRTFLLQRYGSPLAWSQAWSLSEGPAVPPGAWGGVSQAQALEWSRQWPGGLGLPGLDVARFQAQTFRDLLGLWISGLREQDPLRPIFTGRLHRYRSILSVPADYTAIVCDLSPAQVPDEDGSHHALALAFARRGGRTVAIQALSLRTQGEALAPPEWLLGWAERALLKGCGGLAFSDWPVLKASLPHRQAVSRLLERTQPWQDLVPRGCAAVVVSPEMGGPSPLFSYPNGWETGNPQELLRGLAHGTRFGPVDFLPPEGLLEGNLQRYGALFLPSAFDLPPFLAEPLLEYVRSGGVVVADLGFGLRQAGGDLRRAPPLAQSLFGVQQVPRLVQPLPLSEREREKLQAQVGMELTEEEGVRFARREMVFAAHIHLPTLGEGFIAHEAVGMPLGLCRLAPGAEEVGVVVRRRDRTTGLLLFGGLVGHPLGRGYGFWASFPLWARWPALEEGFQRFHAALLGRQASWEIVRNPGLYSFPVEGLRQGARWVLRNHSSEPTLALLRWVERVEGVYPGGVHFIAPEAEGEETLARSLQGFWCLVPPAQLVEFRPLPWEVKAEGVLGLQVLRVEAERIEMRLYGEGAQMMFDPVRGLRAVARWPVRVRLTLQGEPYAPVPGSRHRLEVRLYPSGHPLEERLLTADEQGRLVIEGEWASVTCLLSPKR